MQFLLASNNTKKLREMCAILDAEGCTVFSPSDVGIDIEVEETGATFAENARLKAAAFCDASGLPSIADDSGLTVDALGGRPGVHSARSGGPGLTDAERTALLLRELSGTPRQERSASFVSCICCVVPSGRIIAAEGRCYGEIALSPSGQNGFGYDPVFFVQDHGCTFAEMDAAIKNRISHRGAALSAFIQKLREEGLLHVDK